MEWLGNASNASCLASLVRPPSHRLASYQWRFRSMVTFASCILSFMWRSPTNPPPDFAFTVPPSFELAFRVYICIILAIGIGYGALILDTFQYYGTAMDAAWKNRVTSWLDHESVHNPPFRPGQPFGVVESGPPPFTGPMHPQLHPTFYSHRSPLQLTSNDAPVYPTY